MKTFKTWPYASLPKPIVYIYKEIQLYPVTDSSTWPFPIRKMNAVKFQEATEWLALNHIAILGTIDYNNPITQTIHIKFIHKEDLTAFTLQFGDLFIT
jgi:hypothetical protein